MALSHQMSAVVSSIVSVGIFAGMQLYRHQLASTGPLTILGGLIGGILFMFLLTAIGNLEFVMFGKGFQTSVFPEVALCMVLAMTTAGRIHGVCITTCFLFSIVVVYYVQRIAQKTYAISHNPAVSSGVSGKKNKNK